MVVTEMLSNVLSWTYRLVQHYKTKEQLQTAYNLLQQAVYEAERQRQAEEIKALQLQRELQTQRERLGRDLHDGLGSQLTHLISRLDLLAFKASPETEHLLRLSDFAREMNQTLRETIWLLDQEEITVEAFATRLYGMLLKAWDDREAPVLNWELQNIPENPKLSPLVALHLVRITQEGTNNALKYAGGKQIGVRIKVYKTKLVLSINDNGAGFDAATAYKGFGLTNMRKRAEEVKGSFSLVTDSAGTWIKVVLPLNT